MYDISEVYSNAKYTASVMTVSNLTFSKSKFACSLYIELSWYFSVSTDTESVFDFQVQKSK